jgi:hypothetical protein
MIFSVEEQNRVVDDFYLSFLDQIYGSVYYKVKKDIYTSSYFTLQSLYLEIESKTYETEI